MTNGSENSMVMPVAPMYGGYGNNGGFGSCFGGDGWWILLLLLFAGGGWGNGFGGGFGGEWGVMPYLWNTQTQNDVNRGFDNAGIAGQLSSINSAITSGFSNAEVAECNRAMDAMQTAYGNQIASMNQNFALQTAINQGFNGTQAQLANCCCENRLATANLGSDIAREACATRTADTQNTQALLNAVNTGVQSIKDQLCNDKIDAKNEKIADLERQLTMANLAASQTAQNAFIQRGFSDEVDALYNRLNNCPVPTTPVYGRTPIFQCNQNSGCGCGCGM
mgnify:CR=1 FL=1